MYRITILIWSTFIICYSNIAQSQSGLNPKTHLKDYRLQTWIRGENQPAGTIWDIDQDQLGYIWMATDKGIARFDGKVFYTYNLRTEETFKNEYFEEIEVDQNNVVWAGNYTGLYYYDGHQFEEWIDPKIGPLDNVSDLLLDNNRLWILISYQLYYLENNQLIKFEGLDTNMTEIYEGNGKIWGTGVNGEIISISNGQAKFHKEIYEQISRLISGLAESPNGELYIGMTDGSLWWWSKDELTMILDKGEIFGASRIAFMRFDRNGNLWFSRNGVNRIVNKEIEHISTDEGLSDWRVRSFFEDMEGNMWVGTFSGLNLLSNSSHRFIGPSPSLEGKLHYVLNMLEDSQNRVWVGSSNQGLLYIKNDALTKANGASFIGSRVLCMSEMLDRRHLLVGGNVGLFKVLPVGNSVKEVLQITADFTRVAIQTRDSSIWYNARDKYGEHYTMQLRNGLLRKHEILTNDRVYWIREDGMGRVWFGTRLGLYLCENDSVKEFKPKVKAFQDKINSHYIDQFGHLWLGTSGSGLVGIQNDTFVVYNTRNHLQASDVWGILPDSDRNLWLIQEGNGVDILQFLQFKPDPGNKINELVYAGRRYEFPDIFLSFGNPSNCVLSNGHFLLAGRNGVIDFDPKLENVNRKVRFESVYKNDKAFHPDSSLVLDAGSNNIEFHYGVIDFHAPEELKFEYMLEGYQDKWVSAGSRRKAYFTSLPAGSYTFKVRGRLPDDQVIYADKSYSFTKKEFWWKTPYARVFYALLLILVAYLLFRLRLKTIRMRNKNLELKVEERTIELKELNENLESKVEKRTREITDINQQLTEKEEQLRFALNASNEGIWDWNLVDDNLTLSPALYSMLGYLSYEFPENRSEILDRIHPDDKTGRTLANDYEIARSLGHEQRIDEYRIRKKSGKYIWLRITGKAVAWDEDGLATRIVGTHIDITPEKRKTQEILEAILVTEDNERSRISKEIHDGLQQTLTLTSMNLEPLKKQTMHMDDQTREMFERGWDNLQQSILESRSIAHSLMPKAIVDYGVISAFQTLIEALNQSAKDVNFSFYHNFKEEGLENKQVETTLYRIMQEAANNIFKYAKATQVDVQLKNYEDMIMLTIEDNGVGFDVQKVKESGKGFGLKSMQNRIDAISGFLEIESRPGRGTSIIVQIQKTI